MNRKRWKILIFIFVLCPIVLFILRIDYHAVLNELQQFGFRFIMLVFITFVAYLLGTIGWWLCLGEQRKRISLKRIFCLRQVCETVALYNPSSVVGGDLLKVNMLTPYHIKPNIAAESVIVSRLTAILSQLSLSIIALCWIAVSMQDILSSHWSSIIHLTILLLCLVVFALFYFLNQRYLSKRELNTQKNRWKRLQIKIFNGIVQTQYFFKHKNKLFWLSYFFFTIHWIVGSMELYCILYFLGYDIQMMQAILLDMGIILMKSMGAVVPGQIGIEELGNKLALAAIGIHTTTIWATVSILRRIRQLFWIIVGGLCYFFIRKANKIRIYRYGNPVRQS